MDFVEYGDDIDYEGSDQIIDSRIIINLAVFGHSKELDDEPIELPNVRGFSLSGAYGAETWAKELDYENESNSTCDYYTELQLYDLLINEIKKYNNASNPEIPTRDLMYHYAELVGDKYRRFADRKIKQFVSDKRYSMKDKRESYRTTDLLPYSGSIVKYNKQKTLFLDNKGEKTNIEFGIYALNVVREETYADGTTNYIKFPLDLEPSNNLIHSDNYNAFVDFLIKNLDEIYKPYKDEQINEGIVMKNILEYMKYSSAKSKNPLDNAFQLPEGNTMYAFYTEPKYIKMNLDVLNNIMKGLFITHINIFDFTCSSSRICGSKRPCNTLTIKRELEPRLANVDDVVWNGGVKPVRIKPVKSDQSKKYLKKSRNKKHKNTKSMKRKTQRKRNYKKA